MSNSRKCLIEQFNVAHDLKYIPESKEVNGKRYLGTFEGPAAEFTAPTRNDRLYNLKLWRNVEKDPDFIESMDTLTNLGETDHPDERLDTKITEVAFVMTSFEIRENEGIVWCSFDILDTPNGRILKALLDYGCKIGVSSRGSGEEIEENGKTIIDPDTYYFVCFDAVITPAVAKARPEFVESVVQGNDKKQNLIESVKREITSSNSVAELNSIKSIINSIKLPDVDSLRESIDIKSQELGSGEDISSKLVKDLGESSEKIDVLEKKIAELESKSSADNIRMNEMKSVIKSYKSNASNLRKSMAESKKQLSMLEDSVIEISEQSEEYDTELESLRKRIKSLTRRNESLESDNSNLRKKNESLLRQAAISESKVIKEQKSSSLINSKISNLVKENASVKSKLVSAKDEVSKMQLTESKLKSQVSSLKESCSKMSSENKSLKQRYLQVKSVQCGFSSDSISSKLPENYSINDVDRIVNEFSSQRDRLKKLPIAIPTAGISVNESYESFDEEDNDLRNMLQAMKK